MRTPSPVRSLKLLCLSMSFAGFALGCIGAAPALAALGGDEATVESDRAALVGKRNPTVERSSFRVHEIAGKRVTVREFAAGGKVFGVAWEGARGPDLSTLLGAYFADYTDAMKRLPKARGSRGSSVVRGERVVVERFGHMRWLQGKAYVPEMLPAGTTSDDIH